MFLFAYPHIPIALASERPITLRTWIYTPRCVINTVFANKHYRCFSSCVPTYQITIQCKKKHHSLHKYIYISSATESERRCSLSHSLLISFCMRLKTTPHLACSAHFYTFGGGVVDSSAIPTNHTHAMRTDTPTPRRWSWRRAAIVGVCITLTYAISLA